MKFKSNVLPLAIMLASSLMSGCATITGATTETIAVQTLGQEGKEVRGAVCELANHKGKWHVTSPGSATVTRSNDEIQVVCNKRGIDPGRASVASATKAAMFGNIIAGGGLGAIVDYNSGAAFEYPGYIQVMMGAFTKIDAPQIFAGQPATAQPATTSLAMAPSQALTPLTPQQEEFTNLKTLYDAGLISQEVYLALQRKSLEGAPGAVTGSLAPPLYVIPNPR